MMMMMMMVMMKPTAIALYMVRDVWLFLTGSLQVAASHVCVWREGRGKVPTGLRSVPELSVQVQASSEKFLLEAIDRPKCKNIHIEDRFLTNPQNSFSGPTKRTNAL